jgi:hypothetical protein
MNYFKYNISFKNKIKSCDIILNPITFSVYKKIIIDHDKQNILIELLLTVEDMLNVITYY